MNTTLDDAATEYLEAVRAALADQPHDEVAEIIDDLTDHLDELSAELGDRPTRETLVQRLGTPEQYAEELRTAAGLGSPGEPRKGRGRRLLRFVVTWLIRLGAAFAVAASVVLLADDHPANAAVAYLLGLAPVAAGVGAWLLARRSAGIVVALRELPDVTRAERVLGSVRERPAGAAAVEFIESLRPAWWLLRAWLTTQIVMLSFGVDPAFPLANSPMAVAVLVAAVIGSVWWGRRTTAGTLPASPRRWLSPLNVALAMTGPAVVMLASTPPTEYVYVPVQEEGRQQFEGFFHPDGSEIVNLYVYDGTGRLVERAQLYDQDGRPVENVAPWKMHECIEAGGWYPGGAQAHVFPRPAVYLDEGGGRCVEAGMEAPFGDVLPGSAAASADAESDAREDTVDSSPDPGPDQAEGATTGPGETEPEQQGDHEGDSEAVQPD